MGEIAELDLPDRLAPMVPRWATMLGVGLAAAAASWLIRFGIDRLAPGAAPFALVFPAIMVATLFARWQAGLFTATLSITYAWWRVYVPAAGQPALASDRIGVLGMVLLAGALTIVLAEMFRRAVRRATAERDRQIAARELLLAEFDHRLKNNFAMISSILELQRRRAGDGAAADALATALGRVESIGRAHRHLYRRGQSDAVEIGGYIAELCAALRGSLLPRDGVTLRCRSDTATVPRDRAVSIGLVVNELVTNACKHAFVGRETGTIEISLEERAQGGWVLTVADDGVGVSDAGSTRGPTVDGGLGRRLIKAFAAQAGGTLDTVSDANGTRVTLTLAD